MTRELATVRSYDELQAALRKRAMALRLVLDGRSRLGSDTGQDRSLDAVAGLPAGYAAKLLAPIPIKAFGRTSLGPMLGALGLVLLVVEDAETMKRITARIERDPHRNGYASSTMLAPKRRIKQRNRRNSPLTKPGGAKILNARRQLLLSERERKRIARAAARARWKGKKKNGRSGKLLAPDVDRKRDVGPQDEFGPQRKAERRRKKQDSAPRSTESLA